MQKPDTYLCSFIGYNLKRVSSAAQSDMQRALRRFGLRTSSFAALSLITRTPGLRQVELAQALQIERPNLVPILDDLERSKLITRRRAKSDRRAHALHATLTGQRVANDAMVEIEAQETALTAGLNPDERAAFLAALRRIEANLSPDT